MAQCQACRCHMSDERAELYDRCRQCQAERPYVGNTEGVQKMGILLMAKSGTQEARMIFNLGTAVVRRNTRAKVRHAG